MDQTNSIPWEILDKYFKENPHFLTAHHLNSYNDFFDKGITQIIKERNPIHFLKDRALVTTEDETKHVGFTSALGESIPLTFDEMKKHYNYLSEEEVLEKWKKAEGRGPTKTNTREEYLYSCELYIGGKTGDKLYFGKPIIYDKEDRSHFMYPNEARLRNMTYALTIHYDVEAVYKIFLPREDGSNKFTVFTHTELIEKVYLGKFPIMLQSKQCILYDMPANMRFNMGECRNDPGGYFIIDGKEKVIICQETFADNMVYIKKDYSDVYSYAAQIRSVSEDASKPNRTLSVRLVREQPSSQNGQILVAIPNVRKPMPLFIVMRALGVISDKDIISYCLLDIEKYDDMVELFRGSVYDAGKVFTQAAALKYISSFTKGGATGANTYRALEILTIYFLPHIGERNFKQKALFLGYMVNKLLKTSQGIIKPTNRDTYLYKRLLVSGQLIYQLFLEYYSKQQSDIRLTMDREHFKLKDTPKYKKLKFMDLLINNQSKIFGNKIVEIGFKKAFKGDWGSEAHTKRLGALQDLNRLSFFSAMCQLRKTNVPLPGDAAKIVGPRLLNSTQWGILCPIHSPDGGNVGLHKHLALMTHITSGCSGYPFIDYLRTEGLNMKLLEECSMDYLSKTTKVFVNGAWVGSTNTPKEMTELLRLRRRNALFNIFTSIGWFIEQNEVHIWTDAGRACHPLVPLYGDKKSYQMDSVVEKIIEKNYTWKECVTGFANKKITPELENCRIYDKTEMYGESTSLVDNSAIIEYLDTNEMEGVLLATYYDKPKQYVEKRCSHIEIHPSVILGMMANQIIFPSNNPYPRDAFSCGQGKQAVSLFSTNYQNRMDKSALLLHYGQNPLVRSRYFKYATNNQHPYGLNAIVAVMCYTGYNVEDAVIINQAALNRGLFRTTYFTTYESKEEEKKVGAMTMETKFMDILNENVVGLKAGYDYSLLDPNSGLIRENVPVNDKTIIIGKASTSLASTDHFIDESSKPKKGQLGFIDKSFLTYNEEGTKIAKIRIRHDRQPAIGDKFCSRAGQKGTIGIILPESDMPFTKDGVKPDIIVNPHAMPSRMTIGHLVEALVAKSCCLFGGLGDCTAFMQKGPKEKIFGRMLVDQGFHSSGNEIMYNGMTGEQLETEIYIGPTYYERLKHMVKDKINHRARGPRSVLTRQTVGGRANDGGLRIGEMDRDCVIAHGLTKFLNESMMVRGDQFKMAICNKSGTIAAYNEERNLFVSPMVDGPLKFSTNLDGELNLVNVTRFGRSFSIVNVPYAFKLLYQELQAMNVQMRIITEDNVDQLTSMVKSNNIATLTGNLKDFSDVKMEINKLIEREVSETKSEERKMAAEEQEQEQEQDEDTPNLGVVEGPFINRTVEEMQQLRNDILTRDPEVRKLYNKYMETKDPRDGEEFLTALNRYDSQLFTKEERKLWDKITMADVWNKAPSPISPVPMSSPEEVISKGDIVYVTGRGLARFQVLDFDEEDSEYVLKNLQTSELIMEEKEKVSKKFRADVEQAVKSPEAAWSPGVSPVANYGPSTPNYDPYSSGTPDSEYGFMDFGPQDDQHGTKLSPFLKKRIPEVGYSQAYDEYYKMKEQEEKEEKDLGNEDDNSESKDNEPQPDKIVIRTPVDTDLDATVLPILSKIDEGDEEEDGDGDDSNSNSNTKKLITQ